MSVYAALPRSEAFVGARAKVHVADVHVSEMFIQRVVKAPPKLQRSALSGVRPGSIGDAKTTSTATSYARATTGGGGGARRWKEAKADKAEQAAVAKAQAQFDLMPPPLMVKGTECR